VAELDHRVVVERRRHRGHIAGELAPRGALAVGDVHLSVPPSPSVDSTTNPHRRRETIMFRSLDRQAIKRTGRVGLAFGLLASALVAAPASAQPTITREINIHHDEGTRYFPANPACDPDSIAVTEHLVDNEHLVIVDHGDWLNVTFGESFTITVTPDDPLIAPTTRRGSDAGHFRMQRDGDVIYHESFRDFGPLPWQPASTLKIRVRQTFVTVDGNVRVDGFAADIQIGNIKFDGPPNPAC
jgi:hypothetical protein